MEEEAPEEKKEEAPAEAEAPNEKKEEAPKAGKKARSAKKSVLKTQELGDNDLTIYTVDDLKAFRNAVNGGKTFEGKRLSWMTVLPLWTSITKSGRRLAKRKERLSAASLMATARPSAV